MARQASSGGPSFEAACGDMFSQVKTTFERGMDDIATAGSDK
jgi:hypothetical protein